MSGLLVGREISDGTPMVTMEALITQSVVLSLGIGDGGKLRLLFVQVHVSVGKQREGGREPKEES